MHCDIWSRNEEIKKKEKKTNIKTYVDGNGFFGGGQRDVKD